MNDEKNNNENEIVFKKGDWIVHRQHGVGQVEAIEKKEIGGSESKYFRVKVDKGVYWLPVNKAPDYIRPVSSEQKIRKALEMINEAPQDLPENYKNRNKYIADELDGATLDAKGEMIRDLHARGPNSAVNLTVIDSRQLDQLREQFLREMIVVLGIEMFEAEEELDKALRASVEKMKKSTL